MKSPFRFVSTRLTGLAVALVAASSIGSAFAADAPAAPAKPDAANGAKVAEVCSACHTSDGSRGLPANPILQGQFAEYLAKQLHEFKSGKRENAIMQGMAAPLSETDIRDVSAFYAGKESKPGFARDKDSVLLGQKIYRGGVAERHVPACAGCHSPNGAGIPIQYPRLHGQHAEYTELQLVSFRSGARANNEVMTDVASRMNDREIKAVSDYIAGLR